MRSTDLESVDLVDPSNAIPADELEGYLKQRLQAIVDSSRGWGLSNQDRLLYSLCRVLRSALDDADKLDETQRALKGEQLAHGRTKKKVEGLDADLARVRAERDAAIAERDAARSADEQRKNAVGTAGNS